MWNGDRATRNWDLPSLDWRSSEWPTWWSTAGCLAPKSWRPSRDCVDAARCVNRTKNPIRERRRRRKSGSSFLVIHLENVTTHPNGRLSKQTATSSRYLLPVWIRYYLLSLALVISGKSIAWWWHSSLSLNIQTITGIYIQSGWIPINNDPRWWNGNSPE